MEMYTQFWALIRISASTKFATVWKSKEPKLWEGVFPEVGSDPGPDFTPEARTYPCSSRHEDLRLVKKRILRNVVKHSEQQMVFRC